MDEKIDDLEPKLKAPSFVKENIQQSLDLIRTISDVTEIFTLGFFSTLFDLAPISKDSNSNESTKDINNKP